MNKLLNIVLEELDKKQAEDIKTIDLRNVNPFSDYFVICTAKNHRLALALVKAVKETVNKHNYAIRAVEGDENSDWILIDIYEVVVHIFVGEARFVYQLEKLWGDLPTL